MDFNFTKPQIYGEGLSGLLPRGIVWIFRDAVWRRVEGFFLFFSFFEEIEVYGGEVGQSSCSVRIRILKYSYNGNIFSCLVAYLQLLMFDRH